MAAITPARKSVAKQLGGEIISYSGTGTANQSDTLTSTVVPSTCTQRLVSANINYSAAPTQAGVSVEIDSALGAAYDSLMFLFPANTQKNFFVPDGEVWMFPGDAIRISAPAGGGVITAACEIVLEQK